MRKGFYLAFEGPDGCGKDKIIDFLEELYHNKGLEFKDMRGVENKKELEALYEKNNIVVSVSEPTYFPSGKVLREELLTHSQYSAEVQAEAFSVDRSILLPVILKLKEKKDIILSSRSFISSIVYQSIANETSDDKRKFGLEKILNLAGNRFAMNHLPDYVIIVDTKPEIAMRRLNMRDKKDNAVFEKKSFLEKLYARYMNKEKLKIGERELTLKELLEEKARETNQKIKIIYLDNNGSLEETSNNLIDLFNKEFAKNLY
jgi:thymidylate kinase